jgi:uncharacterized protein (DUF305 family)
MLSSSHRRILSSCALALALGASIMPAAPASANKPRSNAERAFLTDMIGHHEMAVSMAEMAKEKATHQQLKTLADDIIRSQVAEMKRMRSWLKSWYGRSVSEHAGMDHEDMAMLEEASGAEFEVRFMSMMIEHHTQAVERARAVRRSRLHGQVRALSGDIILAQNKEIAELQDWLVAWYAK